MKVSTLIVLLCLPMLLIAGDPNQVRMQFLQATQHADQRPELVESLQANREVDAAFRMAYLGASKALLAENSAAPWTKYNLFVDGTAMLDKAINSRPNEEEFRYLRFIIQVNAPSFLDYDQHIHEDYFKIKHAISEAGEEALWMDHFKSFEAKHALEIRERIGGKTF